MNHILPLSRLSTCDGTRVKRTDRGPVVVQPLASLPRNAVALVARCGEGPFTRREGTIALSRAATFGGWEEAARFTRRRGGARCRGDLELPSVWPSCSA